MAEADIALGTDGGGKKERSFFMRMVGRIWKLKSDKAATENDQELNVKQTFKELIIYLIFLIFVCIIAFLMASSNMFYYTKVMTTLFIDTEEDGVSFSGIKTVDQFWTYAMGAFMKGLYWTAWYNGEPEPSFGELIYYENKLLGPPRIRQIRVTTNSCSVNPEFNSFISECYAEYDDDFEDKSYFGSNQSESANSEPYKTIAWTYQDEDELGGKSYWGKLTTYQEGGYALNLTMQKTETLEMLKYLKNELWIRRGSRAVFLSFTVYNANINLFCVITLCVEFPATGGAEPSWSFDTVKLIRYANDIDLFVFVCEIIFFIFIIYYLIEEVIEIVAIGAVYFWDFWNVLDCVIIVLAFVCAGMNIWRYFRIRDQLAFYRENQNVYQSFEYVGWMQSIFNNLVATLVFFAWVKVFKYISFNKTMTQLSTTLNRCAKDLLGFLIMFAIVFVAFTQLGYLLFGTQVDDFSTFLNSFFTLFRIILGDFDFHQLEQANRILGPIFFMLFVFFVFFVLINMFLAIINDTYSEVKSDMAKQADVFIMSDYVKQAANKLVDKLYTKSENIENIENFLQGERDNQRLSFEGWKNELIKQGYEEDEIEAMFANFDVDNDRSLDVSEQKKMMEELEKQRQMLKAKEQAKDKKTMEEADDLMDDEEGGNRDKVLMNDFNALSRRVERMEAAMGTIIASIDNVISQLK